MKIVAKRCPSCGADLDFEYGDHDVECKACRHKYAIEYEDGHVQVYSEEHKGFGYTTDEALEAMEQFSRALRGSYPYVPPEPGKVKARRLVIGVIEFNALFTERGVTQEMIKRQFPRLFVEYDATNHSYIFTEYYGSEDPAIRALCGGRFKQIRSLEKEVKRRQRL